MYESAFEPLISQVIGKRIGERTAIMGKAGVEFSLVPMGENVIIRELSNVKYPLKDYHLVQTRPLGISNVMLGEEAVLEVEGCVAVIIVKGENCR